MHNNNVFLSFFLATAGIVFLSSCSFIIDESSPIPNVAPTGQIVIDVFAAHGFLGGSSYERYYLENNKLWRECGSLDDKQQETKPSAFPDVFASHPTIIPRDASYEILSSEQLAQINAALLPLQTYPANNPQKIDKAGSLFSLSSGGAFEMSFTQNNKKFKISTTLSAVSNADNASNKLLNDFYALMRGIGKDICASKIFFGIGKR